MALLEVENLTIAYKTRRETAIAADRVNFSLERGRSVGIVGESGCGKTTLGMALLRLLPSNGFVKGGRITFDGMDLLGLPDARMQRIRWKRIAMIFQAAMNAWNPVQRIGDQILEAIRTHDPKITKAEAVKQVEQLYELVEIPADRIFDFPHQYSGGMKQRAIIAMALACSPDLIIADEPTTALDVIVQDQILQKIKAIQKEKNIALIFISHDIGVVAGVCHEIMVMYRGKIVEAGRREEVFEVPVHPYTRALLSSYLTIDGVFEIRDKQAPAPPCTPAEPLSKELCGYVHLCPHASEACRSRPPQWREITPTHKVMCSLCR